MARNPNCYPVSEDEWMAILNRRNGNSISVTVPMAIIHELCLRPGMKVKMKIARMPPRPELQGEEAEE